MINCVFALTVFTTALHSSTVLIPEGSNYVFLNPATKKTEDNYQLMMVKPMVQGLPMSSLTISNSVIAYDYMVNFVKLFTSVEKIYLFKVTVERLKDEQRETLGTLPKTITFLQIKDCEMYVQDFFHLTTVVIEKLKTIEISGGELKTQGMMQCLNCQGPHVDISIKVYLTTLDPREASQFFFCLMNLFPGLTKLTFSKIPMDGVELNNFLTGDTKTLDKVNHLELEACKITAANFIHILAWFPNVKFLYISLNPIGTGFEMVSKEQSLTYIEAMATEMTGGGLVNLILRCPLLTKIRADRTGDKKIEGLKNAVSYPKLSKYFNEQRKEQTTLKIAIDDDVQGKKELEQFCKQISEGKQPPKCIVQSS